MLNWIFYISRHTHAKPDARIGDFWEQTGSNLQVCSKAYVRLDMDNIFMVHFLHSTINHIRKKLSLTLKHKPESKQNKKHTRTYTQRVSSIERPCPRKFVSGTEYIDYFRPVLCGVFVYTHQTPCRPLFPKDHYHKGVT